MWARGQLRRIQAVKTSGVLTPLLWLLDWPEVPDGSGAKAKRKAVAAFVGKQPVRVPATQAHSLHPPRTEEQPQACSIGRRSLTAPVPSTVAS